MNVVVLGLWHLGCVTAACCAEFDRSVVGLDFDAGTMARASKNGEAPLFEPGLDEACSGSGIGVRPACASSEGADPAALGGGRRAVGPATTLRSDDDDAADVPYVLGPVGALSCRRCGSGAVVLDLLAGSRPARAAELERRHPGVHVRVQPGEPPPGQSARRASNTRNGSSSARAPRRCAPFSNRFSPRSARTSYGCAPSPPR